MNIGTNTYITDPLIVGKGVLQEDCVSLLLFNMVINTLIKTIDDERIRCMEYNFCNSLTPETGSSMRTIRPLLRQPNKTTTYR